MMVHRRFYAFVSVSLLILSTSACETEHPDCTYDLSLSLDLPNQSKLSEFRIKQYMESELSMRGFRPGQSIQITFQLSDISNGSYYNVWGTFLFARQDKQLVFSPILRTELKKTNLSTNMDHKKYRIFDGYIMDAVDDILSAMGDCVISSTPDFDG